jgi:hypothetical protein
MDDEERRKWVMNDEGLYNWYRSSRMGLYEFVKQNREELTKIINKALGNEPEEEGWKKNPW